MKTVAIVNPTAGYRRARRLWPRLLASLGRAWRQRGYLVDRMARPR